MSQNPKPEPMLGLSLWNPWGQLVVCGAKGIETRSWPTRHRGLVAIHSTATVPAEDRQALVAGTMAPGWDEFVGIGGDRITKFLSLAKGSFIGVVRLVACMPMGDPHPESEDIEWKSWKTLRYWRDTSQGEHPWVLSIENLSDQEKHFGHYQRVRFAWIFDDVMALPGPLQCTGNRGLWTPPRHLEIEMRRKHKAFMAQKLLG